MRNTTKFARNLIKYMSIQHIRILSWLLGLLITINLQIYLQTSSPQQMNNVPNLPGVNYAAKNWALVIMLIALPLAHFLITLLLE